MGVGGETAAYSLAYSRTPAEQSACFGVVDHASGALWQRGGLRWRTSLDLTLSKG